jgi:hypothetical protein
MYIRLHVFTSKGSNFKSHILDYITDCLTTLWRLSINGSTVLLFDLGSFFSFLILYTVGRTPWTGDQPVTKPLPTRKTTQTQHTHTQTSMPQVGFEPTITALERAMTVHALELVTAVIGVMAFRKWKSELGILNSVLSVDN